jgi:MoxR-like ATPase
MTDTPWKLFAGNGESQPLATEAIPEAPAWRQFMPKAEFEANEKADSETRWGQIEQLAAEDGRGKERGESFRLDDRHALTIEAVNAALHLRRPLLITGNPGSGKTSLAYAIAYELKLGAVLSWAINTRSTLQDALYRYDAIARLQDDKLETRKPIGDYIRLGSVGTAFLPSHRPRVLLIDEIDKCDINLPNDLLELFEEGRYEIPELVRCKDELPEMPVRTADRDLSATIRNGRVFCHQFPLVIMTSNGERDFPPAFLRRCLRIDMPNPTENEAALREIVEAHLRRTYADDASWQAAQATIAEIVRDFVQMGDAKTTDIATDQLLNLVHVMTRSSRPDDIKRLKQVLLQGLSR